MNQVHLNESLPLTTLYKFVPKQLKRNVPQVQSTMDITDVNNDTGYVHDSSTSTTLPAYTKYIDVLLPIVENESTLDFNPPTERAYFLPGLDDSQLPNSSVPYLGLGIPNTEFTTRIAHYCFGMLLIVIGVAGATGNGLVLYVFTRYRRLRGGGVPLILSLTAGDLSVSILHIMPAISSFREKWSFGMIGCELYAAAVGLCGLASLLTLSVIAAERFSVIMGAPIRWLSSKKACVLIWILSLILVFPPFVGWSKYVKEGLGTSCSWDYVSRDFRNRVYYIFLLTFGFFIPVAIIIVSYIGILHVVCKQSSRMNSFSRNGGIRKKNPTRNDLKTAQVVLSIITCFIISWTPYAVCSMIGQFGDASLLSPLGTALPALFAKSSVIYNPFVYGLSHPLFRTAFAALKAQYFGKRGGVGGGVNVNNRQYNYPYRHPHHHNKHKLHSTSRPRKSQLVATAKGGAVYNTPFDHRHHHYRQDGQKMQCEGRGKNGKHNYNGEDGSCSVERCNRGEVSFDPQSTLRSLTEHGISLSCSETTRCNSFKVKQHSNPLKKGVWIFKQRENGPSSESEFTAPTVVPTSKCSSDGDELEACSSYRRKSDMAPEERGDDGRLMKNSYTFFLCEHRKRRQDTIQQTFFRSENCLNDIFTGKTLSKSSLAKWPEFEMVGDSKSSIKHDHSIKKPEQINENPGDEQEESGELKGSLPQVNNITDEIPCRRGHPAYFHNENEWETCILTGESNADIQNELHGNCCKSLKGKNEFYSSPTSSSIHNISFPYNGDSQEARINISKHAVRDWNCEMYSSSSCPKVKQGIPLFRKVKVDKKIGKEILAEIHLHKTCSSTGDMEKASLASNTPNILRSIKRKKEILDRARKSISWSEPKVSSGEFILFPETLGECNDSFLGTSDCDLYGLREQLESLNDQDPDGIDSSLCSESCYASCKSEFCSDESFEAVGMHQLGNRQQPPCDVGMSVGV